MLGLVNNISSSKPYGDQALNLHFYKNAYSTQTNWFYNFTPTVVETKLQASSPQRQFL